MNCDYIADHMAGIVYGKLPRNEMGECRKHIHQCPDCLDAVRGAEALALLRNCGSENVPDGLFDKLSSALQEPPQPEAARPRSSLETILGGFFAAAMFALALGVGWIQPSADISRDIADFTVNVSEPGIMNIAIEADRPLENARISIMLSGDVQLHGFTEREITWRADLDAGVNRLQLPVIANDVGGGKMIVRLDHPMSEQVYVVRVKTTA
jgi:hypothetical protein